MDKLISLTPANALSQTVNSIANNAFANHSFAVTQLFNLLWNNPDQVNLAPPQAFQALGTNAGLVRSYYQAAIALINQTVPNSLNLVEPANFGVSVNDDGSVSIANQVVTEPPTPSNPPPQI